VHDGTEASPKSTLSVALLLRSVPPLFLGLHVLVPKYEGG
jgi:hypothetical protein